MVGVFLSFVRFGAWVGEENGPAARGVTGFHVPVLVSDHPALREIESESLSRRIQHAGRGFPPWVFPGVLRDGASGMERAVVEVKRAGLTHQLLKSFVNPLHVLFPVVTAGDAALVGHDHQLESHRSQPLEALRHAVQKDNISGIAEISVV